MSNIYIQEPPTNGKVLLVTSLGDIDVELWSKEAPKACRNFIQLCMEGYYDNSIFHRIVPGFCVQGGDPTGTGTGGESIYGHAFKDELHQRLRFNRRGLVAMANSGPHDNHSQFFFTLDRADELNGKHTIFGKVAGNTIYNMLKMADCETDHDDRPLYPPKIKKTEILSNPYDDIIPRETKTKKEATKEKKPKEKGTKNFSLLSFGEEAEEDEEEVNVITKEVRMKSSHDLLDDPKLSKNTSPPVPSKDSHKEKKKGSAKDTKSKKPKSDSEESDSEEELVDKVRDKLKKPRLDPEVASSSQQAPPDEKKRKTSDSLAEFREERKLYKKKSKEQVSRASREEQTLALLSGFQSKLVSLEEAEADKEAESETVEESSKSSLDWLSHKLVCEDSSAKVKDANIQNEDTYELFDPRNPINKRRREAGKHKDKHSKRR